MDNLIEDARMQVLLPEKYLEVGLTPDGREVIINHPDLLPDANGVGHIVFSPAQARNLARLLLRKADLCEATLDRGGEL